uniref:Enhancer of split m6 protein n=1 Tax=Zeugodacus cucurbitae TaxID=28588 RepID=A0A0A1WWS6_ZEUCU
MHTTTHKRAPVLCKLEMLACRMRKLFKIGKAKQAYNQKNSANNNNNNCESENNNNINSELCNLTAQLTNEMAQNAANEWLLQHTAATLLHSADTYAEDSESHVICLQTEAGQFYWNAALTQANELYPYSAIDWL